MASTINADDGVISGSAGVKTSADNSGILELQSNGTTQFTLGSSSVVINDSGADVDFRVESDTNANAFFLDGANGNVGIGTGTPTLAVGGGLQVEAGTFASVRVTETGNTGLDLSQASDGKGYLYLRDNADLIFGANNSEVARFSASGNLGLGVTPSAWSVVGPAMQLSSGGAFVSGQSSSNAFYAGVNAYYNGTNWVYVNTDEASFYRQFSGAHDWFTAPSGTAGDPITFTQAMTLDADGDLGVGTTSPSLRLHIVRSGDGITAGIAGATYGIRFDNGGAFSSGMSTIHGVDNTFTSTYQPIMLNGSDVRFGTSATERARITAAGGVSIGTTSDPGATNLLVVGNVTADGGNHKFNATTGSVTVELNAQNASGADAILNFVCPGSNSGRIYYERANSRLYAYSQSGGVYLAATGTSWISTSDERVKDIIEPITDAVEKISNLRTVIGKYKSEDEGKRRPFLIAQDVQSVFPEAVDATNPDELGLSYTDMVPMLVKAIQEQQAMIEDLKAKVAALESK